VAFAIEVVGILGGTMRRCLVDLVGADAVAEQAGTTVVSAPDQAAMIGVLHRLHDLGLRVERVEQA
jgi:hypothetical protein